MKRRDLLEASKLLKRHKMDVTDPAAMMLATGWLKEKADGETDLKFEDWLDEEVDVDEDEDDEEYDSDPT